MAFPNTVYGRLGDAKAESSTAKLPLGTRMVLPDGRVYRYTKNGAVALSIARLCQESVVVSGHGVDLAVASAAAIGATTVTLTNATTAITANEYAQGYLFVNDVDGEGQICTIKSHPAEATGSGSVVMTLEAEDALTVALTTSSQVGLRYNPYKNVLVNPTTATGVPVGVTPISVTANYYFWLQTWGPAAVLTNGTVIVGKTVAPGATTPGSVDVYPLNSVDASGQQPVVGIVQTVGATTEYSLVYLTIAP